MKNKKLKIKEIPLDDYEKELAAFLDAGNYQTIDNFKAEKLALEEAARKYLDLQKSRSITLRISKRDLILVKAKAKRKNIPYQTLINLLINHYAEGQIRLLV